MHDWLPTQLRKKWLTPGSTTLTLASVVSLSVRSVPLLGPIA